MSSPMSWRITDWITASISMRSASAPATPTIAPYWPSNQLAVRSGLLVFSMSSPTLPVTHTAAFVTQAVTPRMTNSPASAATLLTAPETASQTLPTIGRSHAVAENTPPPDGAGPAAAVTLPFAPMLIVNSSSDFLGMHQSAEGGSWSLSSTQKDQRPPSVGVPLTRPFDASERPGGREPLRILNW